MHARTYGTLINTQCGIKEMVHRIFKAMVSQTNCKNIELDLLKRYTTLFAIRHLVDGGIDQRLSQRCDGFANMSSTFGHILTNWYITEDKSLNEKELDENVDGLYCNFIIGYNNICFDY
jgi:predicted HAD superfamily hydrolase